jgi:hypothetical protein
MAIKLKKAPGAFWVSRVLVVEFSANLVGLHWLNLTLKVSLSPLGFLGRPRLGGGIQCQFSGLTLAKSNVKFKPPGFPGPAASLWWNLVPI